MTTKDVYMNVVIPICFVEIGICYLGGRIKWDLLESLLPIRYFPLLFLTVGPQFCSMIFYKRQNRYEGAHTIFRALPLSWSLLQLYISAVLM